MTALMVVAFVNAVLLLFMSFAGLRVFAFIGLAAYVGFCWISPLSM